MTTSRSTGFRNSGALLAVTIAVAIVLGGAGTAIAGRHRVVILEFKGPNAAKFHADVVKIVRKTHTVVGIEKWESAADDLGATKINSKNVKRVAQKLNVDGVIIGEVEKRRDRYILRIKVREGRSGDYTGNPIEATSGDARLDARSTRDLRGELLDTIDTLDPAVSSKDDDDDRGSRASRDDEDEDDDRGSRSRDDDEDADDEDDRASKGKGKDKGKTRGKGKADEDDEDAEDDGGSKGKSGFSAKGDRRGRDQVDEDDEDTGSKAKAKGKGKALADDDDVDADDDRGSRGKDRGDPRTSDGDDDENPLGAGKSNKAKGAGKAKAKGGGEDEDDADVRVATDDDDDGDGGRKARDDEDGEGGGEGGDGEDRVAARDDEDGGEDNEVRDADTGEEPEDDGIDHTSVANRAVDAVIGLSVMRRTLSFQTEAGLADAPQGYRGAPVAGFYLDADLYPLAFSKKNRSITKDLGVTVLADRVIKINSNVGGVKLASKQYRYGVGVVFRYPIGPALLTARLRYSKMGFSIARDGGVMVDVPDVEYTVIDPGLGIVYPFGKLAIGLDAAFMAIPNTGSMQDASQYGGATVTGFDAEAHVDYLITSKIFARAAFHFVTIGLKFKGNGDMTTDRDADAEQDVFSARDTYLGGFISGGYLF